MSEKKCFLCNQLADNPKQCTECDKCFCYRCIIDYYKNEKKCPNCSFSQRLDQYCPVYDSVVNETSSINANNNKRYFCVECLKKFNEKEIEYHIKHHTFNDNILEQIDIFGILQNINKIIGFKNELETNYNQCRNDTELLNSIKKIKLDEIDNIKETVELFYQNKYELLKENENELDRLLSTYKDYINKSFAKISKIISNLNTNNNLIDLLNQGNVKIKKYLNDIEKDRKKLGDIIQKDNSLNDFFNFKSYNGQKIEINQFKWNIHSCNNTINLSLESNPKCKVYIYQNENDRMKIRVDFQEERYSQYKKYFTYLGIFNREKNKTLEIPIKFCLYNKNNNIYIFESNFENIKEFEQLIGDGMELKIYISELEIGNNEM